MPLILYENDKDFVKFIKKIHSFEEVAHFFKDKDKLNNLLNQLFDKLYPEGLPRKIEAHAFLGMCLFMLYHFKDLENNIKNSSLDNDFSATELEDVYETISNTKFMITGAIINSLNAVVEELVASDVKNDCHSLH